MQFSHPVVAWLFRRKVLLIGLLLFAVIGVWAFLVKAPDKVRNAMLAARDKTFVLVQFIPATLPEVTKIDRAHWLNQNWSDSDRYWFHHATQGTATFPVSYEWFMALERPELTFFGTPGRLSDSDFLRKLGFIPSPSTSEFTNAKQYGYSGNMDAKPGRTDGNPGGLPVGFAILRSAKDPTTGKAFPDQLGFTCAACHTGHLEYRNVSLRFDGGPAMVNLGEVERAVGLSIGYTLKIPFRFERFARNVEAIRGQPVDRKELKAELKNRLQTILADKRAGEAILKRRGHEHVEEGFGRLDALNRIGNQVFFTNLLQPRIDEFDLPDPLLSDNFSRHDAPVSFPPIWTTPWFLWAQYDASVLNELVRNAGEALGVKAKVNMTAGKPHLPLFGSTIQMENIARFEDMLRGDPKDVHASRRFAGLSAPRWREAAEKFPGDEAWVINEKRVAAGRELYRTHCFECHRGPIRDSEFDWKQDSFWSETDSDKKHQNWITIGDRKYFNVVQKPVDDLGTDAQQSIVLTQRRINLPKSYDRPNKYLNTQDKCSLPDDPPGSVPYVLALMMVVDKTMEQSFKADPKLAELRTQIRGPRNNCHNERVFRIVQVPPAEPGNKLSKEEEKSAPPKPTLFPVAHYRARPLDGVWATAPYLHNGSVPTLHDMLLPQHKRPTSFCVGDRQFDPKRVGLVESKGPCKPGLSEFDTGKLGNSNKGHSFEGTETKKFPRGVIGPALSAEDRANLLEYLKTL